MIPEVDRYHGVVLRQLLVNCGHRVSVGVVGSGRADSFCVDGAAIQIKHSSKRLSPWAFTYPPDSFAELDELRQSYCPIWAVLVCGTDGIVGVSLDELLAVTTPAAGGKAWVRVSRNSHAMYRLSGARGQVARALPRGLDPFLLDVAKKRAEA